jgi:hypothetical protein
MSLIIIRHPIKNQQHGCYVALTNAYHISIEGQFERKLKKAMKIWLPR